MSGQLAILALRGKSILELRELALRFLPISLDDLQKLDKPGLIALLSSSFSEAPQFARELRKSQISFKPSFYLMYLTLKEDELPSIRSATRRIRSSLQKINETLLRRNQNSPYSEFKLEKLVEHENQEIEIHVSWQRIHWYWHPATISMAHVYELRFGFVILDPDSRKALISCHTEHERKILTEFLSEVYPIELSSMVLTKPILDQIGSFDHVRRAGYFLPQPSMQLPSNISYADENLAIKATARQQEDDPYSMRKQSFYHIPLGSFEEQGVGATSDSGKLWIPRELPLRAIRDYGIELLRKVGATLDSMTEKGEYDDVLLSLAIPKLPKMASIRKSALRTDVCRMIQNLVNMLLANEISRPFTNTEALVSLGVPSLFQYPRLILVDPETDDHSFWSDKATWSNQVRVHSNDSLEITGHPSGQTLDVSRLHHPITQSRVSITDPLSCLHLLPTIHLHETLLDAVKHISSQIPELRSVTSLPFFISGNALHLDVNRAYGRTSLSRIISILLPHDVLEFNRPLQIRVPSKSIEPIRKRLNSLGEECTSSSDEHCTSCLQENRRICLRSLVARYVKAPKLLPHKSIELSDLQGTITIAGREHRFLGFAKQGRGRQSLTARNEPGAKLLSQVLGQVDKQSFEIIVVISSSTLNEDLRDRLSMVCGLLRKHLLFIDFNTLAPILLHFEEQAAFDELDIDQLYRFSRLKPK